MPFYQTYTIVHFIILITSINVKDQIRKKNVCIICVADRRYINGIIFYIVYHVCNIIYFCIDAMIEIIYFYSFWIMCLVNFSVHFFFSCQMSYTFIEMKNRILINEKNFFFINYTHISVEFLLNFWWIFWLWRRRRIIFGYNV